MNFKGFSTFRFDVLQWVVFLTLAIVFVCGVMRTQAHAADYRRSIELSWEEIEDASAYDLLIKPIHMKTKPLKLKVKDLSWKGQLAIGHYEMKVRSRDSRGVPGDWSEPIPFVVPLESAEFASPKADSRISSRNNDEERIVFEWKPVGSATSYVLEIESLDGSVKRSEKAKTTKLSLDLPVARLYQWRIKALGPEGLESLTKEASTFEVIGTRLATPEISAPETEFVREIKWDKVKFAETYEVQIIARDLRTKKWRTVKTYSDVKEPELPFDPAFSGGEYMARVRSVADRRVNSKFSSIKFKAREGDRSPASEFTALIRESIDRVSGWYGMASYFITMVDYSSTDFNTDRGMITNFSALGGTGRLGFGYLGRDEPWGVIFGGELSGFTNDNKENITFAAIDAQGVWRTSALRRGEFRAKAGVFYREAPVAQVSRTTRKVSSYGSGSVVGPTLGAEFWYSLTPKLGMQVNAQVYPGVFALKTPNGEPGEMSVSWQAGVLGSYRINRNFTGLMGYARRQETLRYKTSSTGLFSGSSNETSLSGHYFNLFCEYGF